MRFRLTVLYVVLITLATAALGVQIYRWTSEDLLSERRVRLLMEARITADAVAGVVNSQLAGAGPTLDRHARRFDTRFLLLDKTGEVQADSLGESSQEQSLKGQHLGYQEVDGALAGDAETGVYRLDNGDYVMYAAVPVLRGGEREGALFVAGSLDDVVASLSVLVRRLITAGLAINLTIMAATWLVARRLTSPLTRLNRAAHRLGAGDLQTRVGIQSTDEVGDLAATFNEMAERLEEHDRLQRRFVADASHELRSPIGSAVVLLEALQSSVRDADQSLFASLRDQLERMSRLVNQLLELARLEEWEGQPANCEESTDAIHVVRRVVRRLGPIAAGNGIKMQEQLEQVPPIAGAEENLERIAENLIENAIKYTPEGGTVRVELKSAGSSEPQMRLTVQDSGPGIPPDDLPHIFDRFYRADTARSRGKGGVGLGLAIAARRVELLEGNMEVDSPPGCGTTFSVVLPAQGEPSAGREL